MSAAMKETATKRSSGTSRIVRRGSGAFRLRANEIQRRSARPSVVCVRAMVNVETKMKTPRIHSSARGTGTAGSERGSLHMFFHRGQARHFAQERRRRRGVAVIEKPRDLEPQPGALGDEVRERASLRHRIFPTRPRPESPGKPPPLRSGGPSRFPATAPPRAPARVSRRRGATFPGGIYREQETPWPGRRLPERTSRRVRSRRASLQKTARSPKRVFPAGA